MSTHAHSQGTRRSEKRAKKGSKTVLTVTAAQGSIEVDIKEREDDRGSKYYAEYRDPERGRRRPSLGTDDLEEAKLRAKAIAEELAAAADPTATGVCFTPPSQVTLGELFDLYRAHKLPKFKKRGRPTGHYVNMERVMRLGEILWGRDQVVVEIDETHKDRYETRRKEGGINVPAPNLPGHYDRELLPAPGRTLGPCGARTIRGEIALLSMIFNWGVRHRRKGGGGKKLIPFNPLHGISFACGPENPRTPVMTERRFQIMLQYAPEAEMYARRYNRNVPEGERTALLEIAHGTARRIEAIVGLRRRDILLTHAQVREKLLELGWPEDWADWWPCGAIFWNPEYDKVGYSRVTPISRRLQRVLIKYLAMLGTLEPDAWLFPAGRKPSESTCPQVAWKWFRRIEELAQKHGEDLPRLKWGAFHPFRRAWRSVRAGFFDDKLVALVGGWRRFKDSNEAMQQGYLQYHPRALYLCAEFDQTRDAPDDGRIPGVNVIVHVPDAA